MLNVLSAIIVGLVVGVLARFFYPGPVHMGWIATIGGSLLAGLVTSRGQQQFHRAGFVASIVGAIVLIFVGHLLHIG